MIHKPCHAEFIYGTWKENCIFYHYSTLKAKISLHSPWLCYWWPGNARSQAINSNGIDLVIPDHSGFSFRRAQVSARAQYKWTEVALIWRHKFWTESKFLWEWNNVKNSLFVASIWIIMISSRVDPTTKYLCIFSRNAAPDFKPVELQKMSVTSIDRVKSLSFFLNGGIKIHHLAIGNK